MIITASDQIPGRQVKQVIGLVMGNTIRAKHLGKDIVAGFRNLVGGELNEYTEMLAESRKQAIIRMQEDAKKMGADAIVTVRFTTSSVMQARQRCLHTAQQ